MTVNDMEPGDTATVKEIQAPVFMRQRLMDLGILEGVHVEMIRTAPLGDPIQIRVRDTHLALRRSEASLLIVEQNGERRHERKTHRHRFGRQSKQR